MKKIFLLAILSLTSVAIFTSCQKEEYYCTCNYQTGSAPAQRNFQIGYVSNNTAQTECNKKQQELASYGAQCKVTF
jgi:hypothetical protein